MFIVSVTWLNSRTKIIWCNCNHRFEFTLFKKCIAKSMSANSQAHYKQMFPFHSYICHVKTSLDTHICKMVFTKSDISSTTYFQSSYTVIILGDLKSKDLLLLLTMFNWWVLAGVPTGHKFNSTILYILQKIWPLRNFNVDDVQAFAVHRLWALISEIHANHFTWVVSQDLHCVY